MSERAADDAAHSPNSPDDDCRSRDTPPTPPSPEDADPTDLKGSRKREREVSLEPATPKTDEPAPSERRTPAPKKNRVKLGATKEEDETPPPSPGKTSMELATSPPYETKVRQISRKVRGMKWDDRAASEFAQDADTAVGVCEASIGSESGNTQLEAAAEISQEGQSLPEMLNQDTVDDGAPNSGTDMSTDVQNGSPDPESNMVVAESSTDDQEKRLKRKIGDRLPSAGVEEPSAKASAEASKRARDDAEEDTNPREKKRPTPPPEERGVEDIKDAETSTTTAVPETAAPQPKVGGFLAYASTSSPFASAKGRSVFGTKSTPSPSPLAGTSNGAVSGLSSTAFGVKASPSPFAIPSANNSGSTSASVFAPTAVFSSSNANSLNNLSTSPTGTKRSGFEAFASSSSPFARSKSPPTGFGLGRSKSPTRRAPGSSINAFKSYVGSGTQSFAAPSPPVKKLRQDSGEDSEGGKSTANNVLSGNPLNGASPDGSEDEGEKAASFGDRLRAGKNAYVGRDGSEEDDKIVATEREVHTGEEEEDTIFQVRGKLYALSNQNAWKERGTGLLKLNVRKSDGGGARLVMRKEAVYTLLLNVTLFRGMRCILAQDPRYVRFSCIEPGGTVHYNIRLSNAKVAGELIEEINSNIPGDEPSEAV